MVKRSLISALAILFLFTVTTPVSALEASDIKLLVLGDSDADDYHGSKRGGRQYPATNWPEFLAWYRGVDLGRWEYPDEDIWPRNGGLQYNWSQGGEQSSYMNVLFDEDRDGDGIKDYGLNLVPSMISDPNIGITHVVIRMGVNDYYLGSPGYDDEALARTAAASNPNTLPDWVRALEEHVADNNWLAATRSLQYGADHVILSGVMDLEYVPWFAELKVGTNTCLPEQGCDRQRVVDSIARVNARLEASASAWPNIHYFDQQGFINDLLAPAVDDFITFNTTPEPQLIRTTNRRIAQQNGYNWQDTNDPHYLEMLDLHDGTVLMGITANEMIKILNQTGDYNIPLLSENEIWDAAMNDTLAPTPPPIPEPTPFPTPAYLGDPNSGRAPSTECTNAESCYLSWNGKPFYAHGFNAAVGESQWEEIYTDTGAQKIGAGVDQGGANVVRWWLMPDPGRIRKDGNRLPIEFDYDIYTQFEAALQLARDHDFYIHFSVFPGPNAIPEWWISEPNYRKAMLNFLAPFIQYESQHHPDDLRIIAWELFNEVEEQWRPPVNFAMRDYPEDRALLKDTVNEFVDLVHAHSRSYAGVSSVSLPDFEYWADTNVDYMDAHWYDGFKDYDVEPYTYYNTYMNAANIPASTIRSRYGFNKPIIIGEFWAAPEVPEANRFQTLLDQGYAGAYGWSINYDWTGDWMQIDYDKSLAFATDPQYVELLDIADQGILPPPSNVPGDMDGDGQVDYADYTWVFERLFSGASIFDLARVIANFGDSTAN